MKSSRVLIIFMVMVLMTTALFASGQQNGEAEVVELRYATVHPASYPNGIAATAFAEEVAAKTDGRVKVTVYYAGELGDQKSYIEQCQMGTLDFGDVSASPMVSFVPAMGVLSMPFLYESRDQKWDVLSSDVGKDLLATCESADLYGVSFFEAGARSYYAKTPIRTFEDLQGLKIRVMQSQVCIDQVNAMGASAVPMAFSEIYSAIQSGVIDGNECNHPTYLSQSHYEVCPYFTFDEHVQIPDMLIASKKSLDKKLDQKDRDIVLEIGRNLWQTQLKAYEDNEQIAYDTLVDKGIEFITLPQSEIDKFRAAVASVYDKYEDEYGIWIDKIKSAGK